MFAPTPVMLGPVPVDFILFALILLGSAIFNHHTLRVAVWGLAAVTAYKVVLTGFAQGPGFGGLAGLLAHERVIRANLFGLLMGFGLAYKHSEEWNVSVELPK